ncbi:hypothetical protein ACKVMH_04315 [Lysobacter zhanggongensis]|uniref:Uncharacterized protein n=1 Tax=Lysobacter zhanggongensis TaxID=1774951 RepID=A0ABU7YNK7_9GAMM
MNNINSNDKNKTPQTAPASGSDSTSQGKDSRSAAPAGKTGQDGSKDAGKSNQSPSKS